jgi:hypothetical protein
MRFYRGASALLALTFAMAAALPAAAQPEKITVGGRPAAGQTVRLKIVQDADMTMKPAEAPAGSPMGPMHLKAKTTTVAVQKVGTPDEKGALKIEMTYEDILQDMQMNGEPAPPEASQAVNAMKGKTLAMVVDEAGNVVEVTPPPDFPMPTAMIKDVLKQALGLMPRQEIAVGETVTTPFAMGVPIPITTGEPPQMKGVLKSTLTGLTGAPGSQVAALAQEVTASVDATVAGPGGAGDIAIKMTVQGSGTTDWDVKGALVRGSKMTTRIDGTFAVPGAGAMELSGTTIVDVERVP